MVRNSEIIKDKEVWLLDDVVTMGSSFSACEALLIQAGAKRVRWLAIGKTCNHLKPYETDTGFILPPGF